MDLPNPQSGREKGHPPQQAGQEAMDWTLWTLGGLKLSPWSLIFLPPAQGGLRKQGLQEGTPEGAGCGSRRLRRREGG